MSANSGFLHNECKEKYDALFSNDGIKARCFDELAAHFFDRNFGSISKSDVELMMFNFLMKQMIETNKIEGVIDYRKCSDYAISKILGITESKVRNLKVKKNLVYPEKYSWINSFASILNDNKLTKTKDDRVIMNIPDPNVMIEIKNFIEEQGDYVEYHLNTKILDIKTEYLFLFAIEFEKDHKVDKETIDRIRNEYAKYVCNDVFSDLREASDAVNKICSLFSAGNKVVSYIKSLTFKGQ